MTIPLRQQRTVARPCRVTGFGFWSGRDVTVEFHPARAGTGVVFERADLAGRPQIAAHVRNRAEVPRRTNLASGAADVEMVEHVMAALAGLQIDNCRVVADAAELPGMDGSSRPFIEALRQAGAERQSLAQPVMPLTRLTRVQDERGFVEARPAAHGGLSLTCSIDYGPTGPIGRQRFEIRVDPGAFVRELASARTFILLEEAQYLRRRGIAQRATTRDLLVFAEDGPVDNELRFADECVRHKALDLIGDLALAGVTIQGHIQAHCSGHRLNAELVSKLLAVEAVLEETTTRRLAA